MDIKVYYVQNVKKILEELINMIVVLVKEKIFI